MIRNALTGLFLLLTVTLATELSGPRNTHFIIPESWATNDTTERFQIISLSHTTTAASLNVFAYQFDEAVTANGIQIRRRDSAFDGWINLKEEIGSPYDISRANVDEVYKAIYAKTILDDNLQTTQLITAEYYFAKGPSGYVISISAPKNDWLVIKASLKTFIDAFWIGTGTRPKATRSERRNTNWEIATQSSSGQRNFPIERPSHVTPNTAWQFAPTQNEPHTPPVISQTTIYSQFGSTLRAIDRQSGHINWELTMPKPLHPQLALSEDMLFFVTDTNPKQLTALLADNGRVMFKTSLKASGELNPILRHDTALIISSDTYIEVVDTYQNKTVWRKSFKNAPKTQPIIANDTLIVLDQKSTLHAIDLTTQKTSWKTRLPTTADQQPILIHNQLILTQHTDTTTTLIVLDPATGDILWETPPVNGAPLSIATSKTHIGTILSTADTLVFWSVSTDGQTSETLSLNPTFDIAPQSLIGLPNQFIFLSQENWSLPDTHTVHLHHITPAKNTQSNRPISRLKSDQSPSNLTLRLFGKTASLLVSHDTPTLTQSFR